MNHTTLEETMDGLHARCCECHEINLVRFSCQVRVALPAAAPARVCVDCRHFDQAELLCDHPALVRTDPVTGTAYPAPRAINARRPGSGCGEQGIFFQAKEVAA